MASNVFKICILLTVNFVVAEKVEFDNGYYWRDFKSDIPKDAVPGGRNSENQTTYIGQVLHGNSHQPAKIDPNAANVVTFQHAYTEHITYINVKILCSMNPEAFEWINTRTKHINSIWNKEFISGGYEPGITVYIGRKQLDNELAIGRIVFTNTESVFYTTVDGKSVSNDTFEVLTYNPTNMCAC